MDVMEGISGLNGDGHRITKSTSRKPHRKTRTGCRTCKQRKIKCDEQHPSCANCVKHSVQCDFLQSPSNSESPGPSAQPTTPTFSASGLPTSSSLNKPLSSYEPPGFNMIDLELLHNFCTSTCYTLHNDPGLKTLWKVSVPKLALSFDFVMRGILAISALHMARYIPAKREFYLSHAFKQHQSGLRVATAILPRVSEQNCSAVYIFSALTLFVTLASPPRTEFLVIGDSGVGDWLSLLKGTHSIITTAHKALLEGALGPMFQTGMRRSQLREQCAAQLSPEEDPLQELRHHLSTSLRLEPKDYHVCMHAVEELRKSFAVLYKQGRHESEATDVFIWFFHVQESYLELLQNHNQAAVAVFAYFCVLLKIMDFRWWIEGSGLQMLGRAYDLLDTEHRLWIRWPIEEIGWVPSEQSAAVNIGVDSASREYTSLNTPAS